MPQPTTLKDLLRDGHIGMNDVRALARDLFKPDVFDHTHVEYPSLEGYSLTPPPFDKLPDHVQGFVIKAILETRVQNIFDKDRSEDKEAGDDDNDDDTSEARFE